MYVRHVEAQEEKQIHDVYNEFSKVFIQNVENGINPMNVKRALAVTLANSSNLFEETTIDKICEDPFFKEFRKELFYLITKYDDGLSGGFKISVVLESFILLLLGYSHD